MTGFQDTAESVRDNAESLAVWRANSALSYERERPVIYTSNAGILTCESVRVEGTFFSVWKIGSALISRAKATELIAERMESRMGCKK